MQATDPRLPNRQADLDWLLQRLTQPPAAGEDPADAHADAGDTGTAQRGRAKNVHKLKMERPCGECTDEELLERAYGAANGDKLRRLMQGRTVDYGGDDSAADLGLCSLLAFWCGPSGRDRVDRIFRTSSLCREKWTARADYRKRTLDKAFAGATFHADYNASSNESNSTKAGQEQRHAEGEPDPWSPILSLDVEPPTDPFPLEVFPPPLQNYARQLAHCMNVPLDHVALAMLTVAGAAIGNARRLRINASREQHAALYSAVIDRPGSKKSPMLKHVAAPLHYHQELWRKAWEKRMVAWKNSSEDGETLPRPLLRRIVSTNATVESLLLLLKENQRGIMLLKDELSGLVASHGQYKQGKGDDKQIFLELWSGNSVDLDRKSDRTGDSLHVGNPFLAILGGLQPGVLNVLAGQQRNGQLGPDDGYFDRWTPTFPKSLPAVGDDGRDVDQAAIAAWQQTCSLLLGLGVDGDSSDPESWEGPRHVCMNEEAKGIWRRFTEEMAAEMNEAEEGCFGNFGNFGTPVGAWSKLTGSTGRVALIVHYLRWASDGSALDGDDGQQVLDAASLNGAVKVACWLKSHLRKVHHLVGRDDRLTRARVIVGVIKKTFLSRQPTFKRWELHRHCEGKMFPTADTLDSPLDILVQRNHLRRIELPRKTPGGRAPDPVWEINPALS